MNSKPDDSSSPEKRAIIGCLRLVEDRIGLLKQCLDGKETLEKPLLSKALQEAQQREEKLATVDKEIADLKSQIEELELQAAKFRREVEGH